jgi:hypothetical protein
MVDGVRLVADRAGLAELERLIAATSSRLDAAVVVVGVEAAGHHHQTLVGHLGERDGLVVRLLNPAQVAAVRRRPIRLTEGRPSVQPHDLVSRSGRRARPATGAQDGRGVACS